MIKRLILLVSLIGTSFLYGNVNAVVSVLPQKTFLKAIGGDKVNITLMVKPGNSPHTYEPKPSQMRDISKADVYFSIGVEFEKVWLAKFINQNKKMKVVNISDKINKMLMKEHHHEEHEEHHEEHADHHEEHEEHHSKKESFDPHVWTSPDNVRIIAKNILDNLIKIDKVNEEYYEENYDRFLELIENTDRKIKNTLKDVKRDAKFMVFHPAWGYFAKQYCLTQIAIEKEGKTPKPKEIIELINDAKRLNIKAILTAPEFSDKVAKQIAKELNIPVIKISPLNPKWSKNLINLAKAIENK